MPEFYTIIVRKNISRFFWGVGGARAHSPTDSSFPAPMGCDIGLRDNGFPGPAVALDGPAAGRGGWEMSQRQLPVKRCAAVGSCREDELTCIILPD